MVWKGSTTVCEAASRQPDDILHVSTAHDLRLTQYKLHHHGPAIGLEQTRRPGMMSAPKQPARRPLSVVTRPIVALFGAKPHQGKSHSVALAGTDAARPGTLSNTVPAPTPARQQRTPGTAPHRTSSISTASIKSASDSNISWLRLSSSIRRSFRRRSSGGNSSDEKRRNCRIAFADSERPHPERGVSVDRFYGSSTDPVEVGSAFRCHWHSSYKHATFAEKRKCFDAREATMLLRNRHAVRRTAGHVDGGRRRSTDSLTVSFDSVSVTGPRTHPWATTKSVAEETISWDARVSEPPSQQGP